MSAHIRQAVTVTVLVLLVSLTAAVSASAVTVSPFPGTPTAMPQTQISFLGASASSLSNISVVGSRSGRHSGHLRSYAAATGASFVPHTPFTAGEHVTVTARWTVGKTVRTLATHFKIAVPLAPPNGGFPVAPGTAADIQNFHSEPQLHPPVVRVHQAAGSASAPGYVFAAPFDGPGQWGPMIFDSAGNLVWFKPLAPEEDAADFRTQVLHGKNDLTWWQGKTIILGYGLGEDVIANANYKTVAIVKAGNGMPTDEHEFAVQPNGTALVTAYVPVQANLSAAGGPASGIAVDCAVQEIDIHTGLVMWEWRSLGHVDISQSYSKAPTSPTGYFDYFHVNSAQALANGNVVISARNTWGVYDIDGATGRFVWQLGGKKSTFKEGPGVQFAYQHHARLMSANELSVFDDEGAPTVTPPSRGEIVKLDPHTGTATLVRQLVRAPAPLTTGSQGDVQTLPGGGYMIGWGGLPNFTEFDAAGNVVYDAQLPAGFSYRVYRLPWAAQPLTPPVAATAPGTVYASWNGATTVASWQLLAGASSSQLAVVSTTARGGFETAIPAPPAAFYEVRALSASGGVLGTSQAVAASGG
jgi:hypothetical protein